MTQSNTSPRTYTFGVFELDPGAGELRKQGMKLKLQGQPLEILRMLLERPGEVVTREDLQKRLWTSDTFVDFDHSLNAAIKRLRDTLDDSAETPRYVETLARRGYRFIAAVGGRERTAVVEPERQAQPRLWWHGKAALWVASALVVLLAAAAWFYEFAGRGETIDSVAVLPFVNASADPNTEYLSDGITETLINSLSQLPHLKVMSRDSAFRYKGKETDAQTVGRQLGVRAVFKGTVMQRGDSLTISAELIDARDNSHIWGQQYSRKPAGIFTLQEEIAREITDRLRVQLSGEEQKRVAKHYTENPEAYQDYLKGRYWWNKQNREGFNKGIESFKQATVKDPSYALAYAGLAACYNSLQGYGTPPKEAYPKAKEAALKALELDDTLAEAHASLAVVKINYDWEWSGGEREFQRAIELNPSNADAHREYGRGLSRIGRFEEGISEGKHALELDPLSLITIRSLGTSFYWSRRYDQAIEQFQKTLELDPNFVSAHGWLAYAYLQKSAYQEAITEFEKVLVIAKGGPTALAMLGSGYAAAGRRPEAQKVLDQLNDLAKKKQEYVSAEYFAIIYADFGEKDRAFEWLEKGYEERSIGEIKVDPALDPLRSDPRFQDLLRRMNLQQ